MEIQNILRKYMFYFSYYIFQNKYFKLSADLFFRLNLKLFKL